MPSALYSAKRPINVAPLNTFYVTGVFQKETLKTPLLVINKLSGFYLSLSAGIRDATQQILEQYFLHLPSSQEPFQTEGSLLAKPNVAKSISSIYHCSINCLI